MSTTLLQIKNRKFKFLRRGALQHGSLHMSKLSTFDALQLSISSYGLKTFSHRPKVLFDFCEKRWKMTKIKFLERGFLRDVLLNIGDNFQNDIRDIRDIFQFFHMVKNSIFDFWYSKNKENQIFGTRGSLG